jgi:predicted amidophosphoribosyltransferase
LSSLLLRFKNNESTGIVNDLCKWACTELLKERIKINIIVRALKSNEISATNETSLDRLGYVLAESLNATYRPEVLHKTRITYPLKKIELSRKKSEVEYVYYIDQIFSNEDSILIIDDIYTTGTTANEIIRSIKVANPNLAVYLFTLAKTEFQPDKNEECLFPEYLYKYNQRYPDYFEDEITEYVLSLNKGLSLTAKYNLIRDLRDLNFLVW